MGAEDDPLEDDPLRESLDDDREEALHKLLAEVAHVPAISLDGDSSVEASAEVRAGLILGGHVELLRPLGQGGMGAVWLAHNQRLDSEVAVKFILPTRSDERSRAMRVRRFEREAQLAAKTRNPHVVQIYDHGVTGGGNCYIVMELLEGESLAERIDRGDTLSFAECVLLMSQAGEGLSVAHERGIVHRDIKPHNLFLIRSGYDLFVKVLDFGIAKELDRKALATTTETAEGTIVGTLAYLSPERLLGEGEAEEASDWWALAVVAYEALTGTLPFRSNNAAALGLAILKGDFAPPSKHSRELPDGCDAWFARALDNDPVQRFDSGSMMLDTFAAVVDDDDSSSLRGPNTVVRRSQREVPKTGFWRKPALGWVAALVALGAAVAFSRSAEQAPSTPTTGASSTGSTAPAPIPETQTVLPPPTASTEPSAPSSAPPVPSAATAAATATATKLPRATTSEPKPAIAPAHCKDPDKAFERDARGREVLKRECDPRANRVP